MKLYCEQRLSAPPCAGALPRVPLRICIHQCEELRERSPSRIATTHIRHPLGDPRESRRAMDIGAGFAQGKSASLLPSTESALGSGEPRSTGVTEGHGSDEERDANSGKAGLSAEIHTGRAGHTPSNY